MENTTDISLYHRYLDAGRCIQRVVTRDGVIVMQDIASTGNGYYSGNGNPEWIGKNVKSLRGSGLRKVSLGRHGSISRLQNELGLLQELENNNA